MNANQLLMASLHILIFDHDIQQYVLSQNKNNQGILTTLCMDCVRIMHAARARSYSAKHTNAFLEKYSITILP